MSTKEQTYYCEKCNRTFGPESFYTSNNLEKYPNDGKLKQCKKCITMHVNNWEPSTYTWILQEIDVPYIPDEWNKLLASYGKNPEKVSGMTILGRYLSKMKLKQWKEYRWKDTEFLQELADHKLQETMKRQGYDAQEITTALEQSRIIPPSPPVTQATTADENYMDQIRVDDEDEEIELTDDDKKYLRLKWGKAYRVDEWIYLEKLYNEMLDSYDIQSAGHLDTLKMVCKTSLKSNQLLDIGDVEGAQKMTKMYDSLMKSGKFTAAQNKGESGDFVDSLAEIVALCESDGFIPRYYTDGPQDKVDRTLQDIQSYTHTLVTEEMNLGNLIENAIKQIEEDKEKEANMDADTADDDDVLENELFAAEDRELSDTDWKQFYDDQEDLSEEADEIFRQIEEGEV